MSSTGLAVISADYGASNLVRTAVATSALQLPRGDGPARGWAAIACPRVQVRPQLCRPPAKRGS